MQKGSQNDPKIDAEMHDFSNFFKKEEKYEIKLPLEREHDFTGSEHLKLHDKSIQNAYRIDAPKSYVRGTETYTKMKPKWKSMQTQDIGR